MWPMVFPASVAGTARIQVDRLVRTLCGPANGQKIEPKFLDAMQDAWAAAWQKAGGLQNQQQARADYLSTKVRPGSPLV